MEPNTQPTQSGERMSQGLNGVRERARKNKQERFTALLHHVTVDGSMCWDSAAKGGPPGKSWGNYSITGYPFPKLFMIFQARASTPAAFGRHIRSKNRVR